MYVTMLLQIVSSSLFLDGIEPFFGSQFSMWHSTKLFSSIFDLGPLTPKICTCTKLPINRFVWQIDRKCLGLLGGSRGWPIQWKHVQCCGADPCCHGNEIRANLGYFPTKSPILCSLLYFTRFLELWCCSFCCRCFNPSFLFFAA